MGPVDLRGITIGRDRRGPAVGLIAGIVVGFAILWVYSSTNHVYHLVPDHPMDWLFLAVFVALPAVIAVRNGGLFACWGIVYPSVFAVYLYETTIVIPDATREYSAATVLPAVTIATVTALLWGTAGYLLGKGIRLAIDSRTGDWSRNSG